jgi:hypothetical protein
MSELVERLRAHLGDDHVRGCQGRQYSCDCGYDLKTEGFLELAADELERLSRPSPSEDVARLEAEVAALKAEVKGWQDAAHLSACEAQSGLLQEAESRALSAASDAARLREALSSVAKQCGNVIYNCEQSPADNERHLASWANVQRFADAALTGTGDGTDTNGQHGEGDGSKSLKHGQSE